MSKSKYTKYENEISEMKAEGKTNAEIVKFLNKKYDCGATVSSLKSFLKRCKDKKNETKQTSIAKTVPENQERASGKEKVKEETITKTAAPEKAKSLPIQEAITVEKVENFITNEVEMRIAVKEFYQIKKRLGEASDIFSILNNEFGEAAEKMRKRAKRYKINFLIVGGMIFLVVLSLFTGYHIGRCFSRIAFYYILALSCAPGGICVGITGGFLVADIINRRRIKKLENEVE